MHSRDRLPDTLQPPPATRCLQSSFLSSPLPNGHCDNQDQDLPKPQLVRVKVRGNNAREDEIDVPIP